MNQDKPKRQPKEQFRVVINREANEALERFISQLADDDSSTRITKSELANYLFVRLKELLDEADRADIRATYFDAKKALEALIKSAAKEEELPETLREAVAKHCGIKPQLRERKAKKLSTVPSVDNSIAKEAI